MAWNDFLDKSGSNLMPPSLPDTSLILDQQIEAGGFPGGAAAGIQNNVKEYSVFDGKRIRIDIGFIEMGSPGMESVKDYGIRVFDKDGNDLFIVNSQSSYLYNQQVDSNEINLRYAPYTTTALNFRKMDGSLGSQIRWAEADALLTINSNLKVLGSIGATGGFISASGSPGITQNIEYQDWLGNPHFLVVENGLITAVV